LTFTNRELEKCAAREVAMRKNVFGKRGIGPKEEREIALMEAIAAHFKKLADQALADQALAGPTGDFPHGKLSPDDEGGINVALSHFNAPDGTRMVRLDYGKEVAWLALQREEAVAFASLILRHAGVGIEIGAMGDAGDPREGGQSH
jgi:hypothetical protein